MIESQIMALNSPVFIFLILPIFFAAYLFLRKVVFWPLLFIFSLAYFLWLDPVYFPLIVLVLILNYAAGRLLAKNTQKWLLAASVGGNILLLAFFKLHEANLLSITTTILGPAGDHIPTGISFFIFSSVAYLFDSYHRRIQEQPGFFKYGVFQMFFAKAIAGPIIRFPTLEKNISQTPKITIIASGIRRFMVGYIKKVLIADLLGVVADRVFSLPTSDRYLLIAWVGLIFYTLQIYFDFSGYTDMAIGIGKMFGIFLPENFDAPYTTKSIGEFWRRWHITLSNWFRDYVFFPLERIRRGKRFWTQEINVLIVFFLTGLWHGFTPNFIIWGLIHGITIAAENSGRGKKLRERLPAWIQHGYSLAVIMGSWIFFRTPSLTEATRYIRSLIKIDKIYLTLPLSTFPTIESLTWFVFVAGIILSTPIPNILIKKYNNWSPSNALGKLAVGTLADVLLLEIFIFSIGLKMDSTFSSFLYGNF